MNNCEYQALAHQYIPGGAHTYSRGDDQFPSNAPAVLMRGEGCYVWDAQGEKYLDYGMGLRSVTVGYGYDRIAKAAIEGIYGGTNLTRPSVLEIEAAMDMVGLIDGMDMVKFAKHGSVVTTAATKLARAYTGRKYIARCLEHPFYSYDDWFIGDTVMSCGIPEDIRVLTLHYNFNQIDTLQALFDQHPGEIACVILEPATSVEPLDGFLQHVRSLCTKYGAVMILDEMITGFRWDLHGAQHYYQVVPDLCTFGKGVANGFAVAALMGKKEIMRLGGLEHQQERVFLTSTTHGAEMSGMGALRETVRVYQELDVVGHLWSYGRRLMDGLNNIAKEFQIQDYFYVEGVPASPAYACLDKQRTPSPALRTLFLQEMVKNKVLIPYLSICYSHGETELEITLEAAHKALRVYKDALEGKVEQYLVGSVTKPVFRKYN